MPSWLNKATVYIIAWCIYMTQGVFLPTGGLITQLLVIGLLLVSLYYTFVVNARYDLPIYFKGLNAILAMFSIYGVYLMLGGYDAREYTINVPSFNYLKNIYLSLLPIYSFYFFTREKLINEKMVLKIILFFVVVVTIQYFHNQNQMLIAAMLKRSSAEEFTNNIGYSFLTLIPACVFFYKRPIIQYVFLGYCVLFVIMGMKRGAVLIGAICLMYFLWENLKTSHIKKKIGIVFLSSIICLLGSMYIQKKMEESIFFQKRIEDTLEGESSHRDDLYITFLDYFWNGTSPLQFVLGSGANATLKVSYNYAHNDWLEIAVNQGVIGLIVYLLYWLTFAKTMLSNDYSSKMRLVLQLLFIIYFMKTIFSMSYNAMPIPASFILGFTLAQKKQYE